MSRGYDRLLLALEQAVTVRHGKGAAVSVDQDVPGGPFVARAWTGKGERAEEGRSARTETGAVRSLLQIIEDANDAQEAAE